METWEEQEQGNEGSGILEAAIDELHRRMDACRRTHSHGGEMTSFGHAEVVKSRHLIFTTVSAIKGSGVDSFTQESLDKLRTTVKWVRDSVLTFPYSWEGEAEERRKQVIREMGAVTKYLDGFTEECVLRDPYPSFDSSPVRYMRNGLRRPEQVPSKLAS